MSELARMLNIESAMTKTEWIENSNRGANSNINTDCIVIDAAASMCKFLER